MPRIAKTWQLSDRPTLKEAKHVEKPVKKRAETMGFIVYKWRSDNNRGVLDRIFINKWGVVFFIEFKAPKKKMSKLQEAVYKELRERNVMAFCIDHPDKGFLLLEKLNQIKMNYIKE